MKRLVKTQFIPIVLTVVVFAVLSVVLYFLITLLNVFTHTDILTQLRWGDIVVGLTIYLKTSVDFAILIANLMARYEGTRNRIAIETGTALGNAVGTFMILVLWNIFRNIEWLLIIMVALASLVLLKLAEEGLEHARGLGTFVYSIENALKKVNFFVSPLLKYVIPDIRMKPKESMDFWGLLRSSFTIPFILGLDDFAGYVPLFSIVNVFGFGVGVFAGHMLLNMALFISPQSTIRAVKNPIISFAGSLVFIGLAAWGLWEALHILLVH